MKKVIIAIILSIFIMGCGGSDEAKSKQKRQKINHDFVSDGIKYLNEKDIGKAIQSFDNAIRQEPANVENFMILGQVYMRLRQYDRAVDTFSAAIKVDPDNGEAHFLLATNKALDGRLEGAVASAQRSVELFMESQDEEKLIRSLALLKSLSESQQNKIEEETVQQ